MKRPLLVALTLLLAEACGGTVDPPTMTGDASPDTDAPDGDAAEADVDAGCWRCADRAWRDTCAHPATVAPDSESCAHCSEHCDSTPDAGTVDP